MKKILEKSLTMPKKLKGWTLWGFSTSILSQNIKKLKGGPFGEKNNFSGKKDSQCRKKTERGTLWSRPVWYVTRENPFWFSSLGQMVQFGAIIFCRTFVELFWSVQVVFEKTLTKSHDYSRLFSKEKRRLKKGGGKVS